MEMASEYVEEIERLSAENAMLRAEVERLRGEAEPTPPAIASRRWSGSASAGSAANSRPPGPTYDELLAKFADGTATNSTIRELVKCLDSRRRNGPPMELIQIEVKRCNRRPTGPIKLLGRTGPRSCEDRKVRQIRTGQWSAWWRVLDLRSWVETR